MGSTGDLGEGWEVVVVPQDGGQNADLCPRVAKEGGRQGEGYPTCGRTDPFSHSLTKHRRCWAFIVPGGEGTDGHTLKHSSGAAGPVLPQGVRAAILAGRGRGRLP